MTVTQRQSLIGLMQAILACRCCPPDIRFRAEALLEKLNRDEWRAFISRVTRGRF